ncbi:MAG TPA: hypothetical protein DDY20_03585 [Desulfobulbaceae bacterium]|nr:hypothetical protein [Desulfobulbaceae bacterium]
MRRLLKEITGIPGVTGSCIFDKNEGVVSTELTADLPKTLIEQVGIHFVRLVQMGGMNKLQIRSAHFRFDRYSVVGVSLEKGAILLAVCDSQANCSLIATTAAMLVEDMRNDLERPLLLREDRTEDTARHASARLAASGIGDELRPQLKEIEEALATAIGPVAFMVVADYLSRWREQGPADPARLPELIGMLVQEIDDKGLVREFKGQLNHFL